MKNSSVAAAAIAAVLDLALLRLCGCLVGGIVAVLVADIGARNLLERSFSPAQEVAVLLQLYVVFLASAVGYHRGAHMLMGSNRWLGVRGRRVADKLVHVAVAVFCVIAFHYGVRLSIAQWQQLSPALGIPVAFFYLALPAGCAATLAFCLLMFVQPGQDHLHATPEGAL
jgi:TRAP-type C4-dicarboxylate transport system permease small subunit